jgi:hypothetical protein
MKVGNKDLMLPRQAEGSPPPWELRKWPYLRTLRSGFISRPTNEDLMEWPALKAGLKKAIDLVNSRGPMPVEEFEQYMQGQLSIVENRKLYLGAVQYNRSPYDREFNFGYFPIIQAMLQQMSDISWVMCVEIDIPDSTRIFDMSPYVSRSQFYSRPPWLSDFAAWLIDKTEGKIREVADPEDFEWFKNRGRQQIEFLLCAFAKDSGYGAKLRTFGDEYVLDIVDLSIATVVSISESFPLVPDHRSIVSAQILEDEMLGNVQARRARLGVPAAVLAENELAFPVWSHRDPEWEEVDALLLELKQTLLTILRLNENLRQMQRTFMQDVEIDYLILVAAKKAHLTMGDILITLGANGGNKIRTIGERLPLPGKDVEGLARPSGYEQWPDHLLELALNRQDESRRERLTSGKVMKSLMASIARLEKAVSYHDSSYNVEISMTGLLDAIYDLIHAIGTPSMAEMAIALPRVLDA